MAGLMTNGEGHDPRFPEEQPEVFPRPFGNYLLLARLAQGGMGEVYLAKHGGLAGIEKHCVVKTLRSHFTQDREYVTRFIDEARVVVGLAHRNIAPTFDVGRVGTQYYLAMEFIPGRDLRSIDDEWRARYARPLDEAMALHIVCEVLEALDYAHRAKDPVSGKPLHLIHRDISPQNVMLSLEGEVKLIDFGLAQSTQKEEHTQPHVVMGKMAYMAPEQARGEQIDSSVDLFAVAVMAYELVMGERYYGEFTLEQIWSVAGRGDFKARRFDELPPALRSILAKALHADKRERHKSCGDLREDLLNYMQERSMRAGSRDLRTAMESLFGEDADQHRAIIQQFADAKLAEMPQVAHTPSGATLMPNFPKTEESVSFLASQPNPAFNLPPQITGLSSPGLRTVSGPHGVVGTESTGETARILKAPALATKGKAAVIAATGAGALFILALALVLTTRDPGQDESLAPVVQAIPNATTSPDDGAPTNASGTGENGTGENGTGENGTGEDGTGENGTGENGTDENGTGDEANAGGTDTVDDGSNTQRNTSKRRTRTRRVRQPATSTRLSDSLRSKPLKRPVDKLNFLRDHCTSRVSCARQHTNAVKKSPEELLRLIQSGQIDNCIKQCRK